MAYNQDLAEELAARRRLVERVSELESEGARVEAYVVELQAQVRKLEAKLAAARELVDELRGYCSSWDYKYGKGWDEQRKALD